MRTRGTWGTIGGILLLVFLGAGLFPVLGEAGDASGKLMAIGTTPAGGLFHSVGSGLAKVVTGRSPVSVTVRPFAGTGVYVPLIDARELEMGVVHADDSHRAYVGMAPYKQKNPNLRLLSIGSPLLTGFMVKKDSPLRTVHDLKGRRVPAQFTGALGAKLLADAILAGAWIRWEDVTPVPVANVVESLRVLLDGRADAGFQSVGSAATKEAHAKLGGIRYLGIDTSPEGVKRMQAVMKGSYPRIVKGGTDTGFEQDIPVIAVDMYLVTHQSLSEEGAYLIVKAIWENSAELAAVHPSLKEWVPSSMVKPSATLPFHPGAIRFYREKGVWTAEMERVQGSL